jgi:hypothetical protein
LVAEELRRPVLGVREIGREIWGQAIATGEDPRLVPRPHFASGTRLEPLRHRIAPLPPDPIRTLGRQLLHRTDGSAADLESCGFP